MTPYIVTNVHCNAYIGDEIFSAGMINRYNRSRFPIDQSLKQKIDYSI